MKISKLSRSTWACELKCQLHQGLHRIRWSRSTWACELKCLQKMGITLIAVSRSTWACELKCVTCQTCLSQSMSRSTWACELKFSRSSHRSRVVSHAPRERVSWNAVKARIVSHYAVTLHVSVWVEMTKIRPKGLESLSHAPRERVSWNTAWIPVSNDMLESRSTWACELKSQSPQAIWGRISHAPRERVSWNGILANNGIKGAVTLHVSVWVEMIFPHCSAIACASRSTWACELKCRPSQF